MYINLLYHVCSRPILKTPLTVNFFMNKACSFPIQSVKQFPKYFIWYPSVCENVRKFEIKFSLMLHSRDSHLNYKYFIWYPFVCENVRKFEIKFSLMLPSRDSHLK